MHMTEKERNYDSKATLVVLGKENIKIDTELSCPLCHKKYKQKSALVKHLITCGEKPVKKDTTVKTGVFQCRSCGKVYKHKNAYDKHVLTCKTIMKEKEATKNKVYPCTKCNKVFKTESGYNKHVCKVKIINIPDKKTKHQCKFCNKYLSSANSLIKHKCEPSKRYGLKDDREFRIAFLAYLRMYDSMGGFKSTTLTNEIDFVRSSLYTGFMKFGKYAHNVGMYNVPEYIEFLAKNDVALDKWCDDGIYYLFVSHISLNETPYAAIEKTIKTMHGWGEETGLQWSDYFESCNQYKVISNIKNGKVSPWVIYNTTSGKNFLRTLDKKTVRDLYKFVDPDKWMAKMSIHKKDVSVIVSILTKIGM